MVLLPSAAAVPCVRPETTGVNASLKRDLGHFGRDVHVVSTQGSHEHTAVLDGRHCDRDVARELFRGHLEQLEIARGVRE
eukprot:2284483-Rhodomonas_salina.3